MEKLLSKRVDKKIIATKPFPLHARFRHSLAFAFVNLTYFISALLYHIRLSSYSNFCFDTGYSEQTTPGH